MTDQEDPKVNPIIQKYGCYLLSIIWLAVQKTRHGPKTADEVNAFYQELLANGHPDIMEDCTVDDPEAVFEALGVKVKQMKTIGGSVALAPTETVLAGFEILCYYWKEKGYYHFVAGDGHGNVAYDPIHRGANTVKKGVLHSKRLFAFV